MTRNHLLLMIVSVACTHRPTESQPRPAAPATNRAADWSEIIIISDQVETGTAHVQAIEVFTHGIGSSSQAPASIVLGNTTTTLKCRTGTACKIDLPARNGARIGLQIFTMEPAVEVSITATSNAMNTQWDVEYTDQSSLSATLGTIITTAHALHAACTQSNDPTEAALNQQLGLERHLTDARPLIRDTALLALTEGRCVTTATDGLISRATLGMDPHSPALAWWPSGFAAAAEKVDVADGWAAIDSAAMAQDDPEKGALLLANVYLRAQHDDPQRAQEALLRLRSTFSGTRIRQAVEARELLRHPFKIKKGDVFPTISASLESFAHNESSASTPHGPILYYITSLRCGSCKTNLPSLRSFAATNHHINVAILLWDDEENAEARFHEEHGPTPGMVIQLDDDDRRAISSTIMTRVVFPSFVLTDQHGHVMATSNEGNLDDIDRRLDQQGLWP